MHVTHILCTGGIFVFSHEQNLNSDLDCTTQRAHAHKQKYTQLLRVVLLRCVAFSFQRDLTSKRAFFTFQRRAQTQKATDVSTGRGSHTLQIL